MVKGFGIGECDSRSRRERPEFAQRRRGGLRRKIEYYPKPRHDRRTIALKNEGSPYLWLRVDASTYLALAAHAADEGGKRTHPYSSNAEAIRLIQGKSCM